VTSKFNPFRVVALNGSLRKHSINGGMIQAASVALKERASVSIFEIGSLPFYNPDLESDLPVSVSNFLNALRDADGIIVSTPEYNLSFTGVLKNALEWASRGPLGAPMRNKPVAIMGASPIAFGTAQAQSQLRQVLFGLQVNLIERPLVMVGMANEKFDQEGNLHHEETKGLIKQQMDALCDAISL